MKCEVPIQAELVKKYLNRQLDEAAEEELEVHILDCPACSATLEALLIVREDLVERAEEIKLQRSARTSRFHWRIIGLAFAMSVTAAIILDLSFLQLRSVKKKVQPIASTNAATQDLPEVEAAWRQTLNALSHGNNAEARALFANFNEAERAYLRSKGRTWQIEYLIGSLDCQIPDSRANGVRLLTDVLQNNRILNNAGEQELKRQIVACTSPMSTTDSQPHLPIDIADASAHFQHEVYGDMKAGADWKFAESAVDISPIPSSDLIRRRVSVSEPQKALASALARLPAGATGSVVGSFAVTTMESKRSAIGIGKCLQRYIPILSHDFQIMPSTYMITIYNVDDRSKLVEYASRLHGLNLPLGVIAYSVPDDMSLTAEGFPRDCGSMAHELVHLLIKNSFPMSPAWLEEGLASEVAVTLPKSNSFEFSWSWRDDELSRHFHLRPTVGELLETPWTRFNAVDDSDVPRAAALQGMAAAFIRFLYFKGALSDVYFSARDQHFSPDLLLYKSYREIVEERLDMKVERIDAEFVQWFSQANGELCGSRSDYVCRIQHPPIEADQK